ncbi:4Fe-4S dicluster domain-containing protein [Shimia sediminis]|uniref:4Fe-4S dicluster domain-containing protein n=1 Tax=Shimia sediminis TaxID=2497945 RepID=UPI000F8D86ED|nr:4Fe-4S dicluster domain-containing protein [Shimia sediminis]
MARENPHRPFTPDPEQMAVFPEISGNDVNGLGEETPRPVRMIYWAPNPPDIPHGDLQMYFYGQSAKVPAFAEARAKRQEVLDAPLPAVAPEIVQNSPEGWTNSLTQFIESGDCELAGVAEVRGDWIMEGHEITQSRVIVLGVVHDYGEISQAPDPAAGLEVMAQYGRAAAAAKTVAGWLREQGWDAEPITGPMSGALLMIPAALSAGFGELGKHGSIINPTYGSSFRLSAVLTNAPFAPTPAVDAGIDGFCASCKICEDACPPEAIFQEKQMVRGKSKWYVNFDKCLPFFNQTHGCAICIAVCPWSRPGVGPNLAAKLARRAERLENEG